MASSLYETVFRIASTDGDLDDLARSYVEHGAPELPSDLIAWMSAAGDTVIEGLLRSADIRMFEEDPDDGMGDSVLSFLEEHGRTPVGRPRSIGFVNSGSVFRYITCEAVEETDDLHGLMVHGRSDRVFGHGPYVRAEAALVAVTERIRISGIVASSRNEIETQGFLSAMGRTHLGITPDDWFSGWGLRWRRLDGAWRALRARAAALGLYREFPRTVAMNIDLSPRSVRHVGPGHPLFRVFGKAEFDRTMTREDVESVGRCFADLLELGVVPEVPMCFNACVRFRRYSRIRMDRMDTAAWYNGAFRTMFVHAHDTSNFVHEYGHMADHALGRLSGSKGFRPVYDLYRREILAVEDRLGDDRDYYLRRTEAFARCLEIHVWRRYGVCVLQKKPAGPQYPESEDLGALIDGYFDNLVEKMR